ncbi:GA module-containing protein [Gardnerella vaginalis]|nr:GA module-containing protein [Gardnerella vaginalis]
MSVFLKQMANKQTPKETEHNPQGKTQYKYKVQPVVVNGDSPTPLEKVQALKAFIKSNYGTDLTYDTTVIDTYSLKDSDKPVDGTQGMWRFVQGEHEGAGILTIGVADDGSLEIQGYEKGDTSSKKLFTVPASELYVKKNSNIDHTLSDLKQQAKDLLKKRTDEGLTKDDLKRAGITDADKLDNNAINGMDEKALRDLIRKLTDAEKAERKYNPIPEIEVTDPENLSEADFKKAAEAFLKANYDGTDSLAGDKAPYNVPTSLTPKTDTVKMELSSTSNANGIAKVTYKNSDFTTLVFQDSANNDLFSVKVTYKKAGTPAPTPDAGQLQQMKDDAKKIIDRNPKLTEEQKTQYKNEIDNAKGADDIQNILKKANEQAGKNNVTPEQLKEKEKKDKENKEKEQKKEEDKKQEDQKKQELQDKKKKASDAIDGLGNLTQDEKDKLKEKLNGKSGDATKPGAKTPEEVQQILDEANNLNEAHKDVSAGALPFLSHGNANSEDDKALKELIGSDPSKKDAALTALEDALAKKDPAATAEEIKTALDAAKRQNAINEQNAKNAGIAKLDAKKAELDAAYKALNDEQKAKAKDKYEAATKAIDDAKNTVNSATKPSDIKNAVDGVKTSFDDANKAIEDAKGKRDTSQNTYDDQSVLNKEKEDQKKRIQDSDLPDAEKQKAIEDINNAKKLGDPTGIANRALKAKKIADALKKIDEFKHLNKAQKDAFKAIINGTDAGNHKDDDGNDTGVDDIDDALVNATNTDTAMGRLEKLKEIADKFAKGEKFTGSSDQTKKDAFNTAATAAGAVLDKAKGDAKNADQVNELYKDLLKTMQDLDNTVKGAGVNTEALNKEIESDKNLQPNDKADPKTPGDSLYTTASKEKKEAFDKALSDAEAALNKAKKDNADQAKPDSTPRTPEQEAEAQKAVDDALQKLENARKALDGVDTTALQNEIGKDNTVKDLDKYKYADKSKTDAFDQALKDAKDLIDKLTGTKKAAQGEEDVTTKTQAEKQKLVDAALAKLKAAEEALDGKKPVEPTPTPSVDKSHLQQGINGSGDVKKSDDYTNAPSDKKQAYDHALDHANEVNNNPNATQDQVNQAAEDLKKAENDLKPTPTPLPNPGAGSGNAGSGSEAGYGVNDNAPTIVDKGELNIQIDSAETDSKPGNAGAGNAGNAGNANAGSATGAQGGAGTSSGAGVGAGTAGAANAGVDNKAVNNAVENSPEVKQADAAVKQAAATLDEALAQAKRVAADPHATQAQVDAAAVKLADARKALADAQANAAKVRAAVRSRVIKGMRSRGNAGVAAGADVATAGLMATMIAAIGGAFVTRRMRAMHANRD